VLAFGQQFACKTVGIVGTSRKPDEHRLPIHPEHIERIDVELRHQMLFERGYAHRFGVSDEQLAAEVAGLCSREQLMEECDVLVLPKPLAEDLTALRPGAVLWGWPHCVQNEAITQVAIDRRLTLIAWEAMYHWTQDGSLGLHVFHKHNELAGYCSVVHTRSGMHLLRYPRVAADRHNRRLWPASAGGGGQLRRHCSWGSNRAPRARGPQHKTVPRSSPLPGSGSRTRQSRPLVLADRSFVRFLQTTRG